MLWSTRLSSNHIWLELCPTSGRCYTHSWPTGGTRTVRMLHFLPLRLRFFKDRRWRCCTETSWRQWTFDSIVILKTRVITQRAAERMKITDNYRWKPGAYRSTSVCNHRRRSPPPSFRCMLHLHPASVIISSSGGRTGINPRRPAWGWDPSHLWNRWAELSGVQTHPSLRLGKETTQEVEMDLK